MSKPVTTFFGAKLYHKQMGDQSKVLDTKMLEFKSFMHRVKIGVVLNSK